MFSIEELRSLLQDSGRWLQELETPKRNVVDLAISEINERSDEAGFSVTYEGMREDKGSARTCFTMTKVEDRKNDEALSKRIIMHKRRVCAAADLYMYKSVSRFQEYIRMKIFCISNTIFNHGVVNKGY